MSETARAQAKQIVNQQIVASNGHGVSTSDLCEVIMLDPDIDHTELLRFALPDLTRTRVSELRRHTTFDPPAGITGSTKLKRRRKLLSEYSVHLPSQGVYMQILRCSTDNLREVISELESHIKGTRTNVKKYRTLIAAMNDESVSTVGDLDIDFVEGVLK